ncbi:MAG: M15 family metallopeptidase [Clostridiales bacterium]|nr:M15 family metallopeptidase [Clostridiales bacterium]
MEKKSIIRQDEILEFTSLSYYDPSKIQRYYTFKENQEECTWEEVITFVNLGLDQDFYKNINLVQDPDTLTVLVNKYNQLPKEYVPRDLEIIHPDFNAGEFVLCKEAREAFEEMSRVAREDGILLKAISTYRSYQYQEEVYLRKKTPDMSMEEYRKERDRVSARPGHSEHQTGYAVDINDLEETFAETAAGIWLATNAYHFGFILRYPKGKEHITGYAYEPWHFRYIGKKHADKMQALGITYDEYYIRYLLNSNPV